MSKIYNHRYIYRPTELEAFEHIERQNKLILKYGLQPNYTEFEKKVYIIDLYIKQVVIPKALQHNRNVKFSKEMMRIPIPIYEIGEITNHTSQYIQRVLDDIDNKAFIREQCRLVPYEPEITVKDIDKHKDLLLRIK